MPQGTTEEITVCQRANHGVGLDDLLDESGGAHEKNGIGMRIPEQTPELTRTAAKRQAQIAQLLVDLQNMDDRELRLRAVQALRSLRPVPREAIEGLEGALCDTYKLVRYYAARVLGEMGPDAKASLPRLHKCIDQEKDGQIERAILSAINSIDTSGGPTR